MGGLDARRRQRGRHLDRRRLHRGGDVRRSLRRRGGAGDGAGRPVGERPDGAGGATGDGGCRRRAPRCLRDAVRTRVRPLGVRRGYGDVDGNHLRDDEGGLPAADAGGTGDTQPGAGRGGCRGGADASCASTRSGRGRGCDAPRQRRDGRSRPDTRDGQPGGVRRQPARRRPCRRVGGGRQQCGRSASCDGYGDAVGRPAARGCRQLAGARGDDPSMGRNGERHVRVCQAPGGDRSPTRSRAGRCGRYVGHCKVASHQRPGSAAGAPGEGGGAESARIRR